MQITLTVAEYTIDDSDYWQQHHPSDLLLASLPNYDHWQDLGIEFTIADTADHNRFTRLIKITATGEEQTLVLLLLGQSAIDTDQ